MLGSGWSRCLPHALSQNFSLICKCASSLLKLSPKFKLHSKLGTCTSRTSRKGVHVIDQTKEPMRNTAAGDTRAVQVRPGTKTVGVKVVDH